MSSPASACGGGHHHFEGTLQVENDISSIHTIVEIDVTPFGGGITDVFLTSLAPGESDTPTPRIQASVRNDSPYRVTDVQLEVEGLTADDRSVGRRVVWALGDIESGGESSFVIEAMDGAVTYRITVTSFDLVSVGSTR